ncbi:AaceriADR207Cp [[Ashbya] aceris (nom. inval.)]|nr:AaceriADR207Cp [[Ashbya] aceris (nom. inval.)]
MDDIRYNFLETLDHLPCEVIRTLWTVQGLELQGVRGEAAVNEARHLQSLVRQHIRRLEWQRAELKELAGVAERYRAHVRAQRAGRAVPQPQLKIRISLKRSRLEAKQGAARAGDDEARYCFCGDVSYGRMVACDNARCPHEWFHYGCVGLAAAPAANARWFCSERCRRQARR